MPFVLTLLLVVQKRLLDRRATMVRDATRRYVATLSAEFWPDTVPVDPRCRVDRMAMGNALSISGELAAGRLREAPWYGEMVRCVREKSGRGKWGDRVIAFELLGNLGAVEERPFLFVAARREPNPQVYAAILWCLAQLVDKNSELLALWHLMRERAALSGSFNEWLFRTAIAALVCTSGADNATNATCELLADAPLQDSMTLDLISAIGKSGLDFLVSELAVRYGLAEASKSMRIACVRSVGMLQPHHPLLLRALEAPEWEVCASAAKFLRDRAPGAIEALSRCLTSPAFHVRLNAASTLAALGTTGLEALARALASRDPFARDVSRYALHLPQPTRVDAAHCSPVMEEATVHAS